MHKKLFLFVVLPAVFLALAFFYLADLQNKLLSVAARAIEFNRQTPPAEQSAKQFNPSSLAWSLATSSAEWEARDSAASFVFRDKIWTMGGLDGNGYVNGDNNVVYWKSPHFNDIWSSEDGVSWKLEKAHAEWPPRRAMTVVEFQNKLRLFGGWSPIDGYDTNDVWQSDDGVIWTKLVSSTSWAAREGHTAEVFDNKIWLFGGVNYDAHETKNDVWYSDEGMNWRQATATIPWSARWDHATAVFKGKIFLAGGMDLKGNVFNDIWVSPDGSNWELMAANAPWASRQGHSLVVFKDKLWLVGRLNDSGDGGGANDLWYSDDGITWQKTDTDPPWLGREDHSALVFKDRIWVFGGMGSDWKWKNDIWYSEENISGLSLSAKAFVSVFVSADGSEKILAAKNENEPMPMASITKLMTALAASEFYKPDSIISVTNSSLGVKGANGIYKLGESFLFADALRALLIASHNEMASAMAEQGGTNEFVAAMNKKAAELGLSNTSYSNPIGTDPDGASGAINRSSALNVFKLAKYISENAPGILEITGEKEFRFPNSDGNPAALVTSTDELLWRNDLPFRIIGGKTGETPRAGKNLALVTEAPCGGRLFSVVLGSKDNFDDMERLLRYASSSLDWLCK